MVAMDTSNADRTTSGKKRRQMVTGETSAETAIGGNAKKLPGLMGGTLGGGTAKSSGTGSSGFFDTTVKPSTVSSPVVPNLGVTQAADRGISPVSAASVGNTGGTTTAGTQGNLGSDYTGWAAGMRPDAANMLFQEPQALLRQVMAKMGLSANDNPGLYNMALPNADLANALALIGLGGQQGFQQGDINSVLNNMGDFFQQGLTRGGQGVDFNQGMKNIMGAGQDTALGGYLNLDDPQGQYQALASLMMPLAEAGLHPLFAKSLQNQMQKLRDEYYQRYAYGTPPTSLAGMVGSRLGLGQ